MNKLFFVGFMGMGFLWAGIAGLKVSLYLSSEPYPSVLGRAIFFGLGSIGFFLYSAAYAIRIAILAKKED